MRQHLLDLYELQKIDLSIREQEQQRAELPTSLRAAEAALHALTQQAEQLGQDKQAAEREARQLSALLDDERDKIRKWEARLGDLRNQREYQALHRETEGQRRANRDSEERLQASYRLQETLDQQLATLTEQIEAAKAAVAEQSSAVEGELQALDERTREQQARRAALVPNIPKALFRKYDQIRARRQGLGLSLVRDGSCISCHMRLPPQLYNVLQRADSVEQCPSCHRVIAWEAWLEQPAASPEAASEAAGGAKKVRAPRKAPASSQAEAAGEPGTASQPHA